MVRPTVDQLRADAFKLSKILATYKVKLSSQQCLDALARLHWNQPYEVVITRRDDDPEEREAGLTQSTALAEWLRCAESFCGVVKTLDPEGVNQAAWNGHKVPADDGLHWDAKTYLRAAGAAAESFSRTAEAFLGARSDLAFAPALTFSVEAAEPIVDGQLAVLRIQCKPGSERKSRATPPTQFLGIDRTHLMEHLLYGAEARVCLTTRPADHAGAGPYRLVPGLSLTYRVSGQQALRTFASTIEKGILQPIWKLLGPLQVETRILLTRENVQDSIDDEWTTADDSEGARLLKFCQEASQLGEEETRDWPPYLEVCVDLGATSTEDDLGRSFGAMCAHALCITGGGSGWREIMENFEKVDPKGYSEMLLEDALLRAQRRR